MPRSFRETGESRRYNEIFTELNRMFDSFKGKSILRRFLTACLGAALAAWSGCARDEGKAASHARAVRRSNINHVILITIDTVRADHLGCYGCTNIKTPRLDAIAATGVRFDNVIAAAPTTLASHTSIMTGTAPHSHGVPRNGFRVNEKNVMLAEILRDAGFKTSAVIGAFALDSRFGFNQGFDHYDDRYSLLVEQMGDGQDQRRADKVTDAAIDWIDGAAAGPFFLFVHYFDAHAPYDPPPPYDTMYPRDAIAVPHSLEDGIDRAVDLQQQRTIGRALGKVPTIINGPTRRLMLSVSGEPAGNDLALDALYRGEISYVDHHLGRLLDHLNQRGLLDDALVVITADHGETMWEHGDFWNHGLWVYDTTVSVPLIIHFPGGSPSGVVVKNVVSTIDIAPTILDLLGIAAPERMEGRSLVPACRGEELAPRAVFSEATQPYRAVDPRRPWQNEPKAKCVRKGRWKYIFAPFLGLEELYDIHADAGERHNLIDSPSADAKRQADRLRATLTAWTAGAHPLPSDFVREQRSDTAQRLRSLGYVADDKPDTTSTGH